MSPTIPHGHQLDATTETRIWAASALEGYETKLTFSDVQAWERCDADGRPFRKAFQIAVAPASGKRWFRIWAYKGITEGDFRRARKIIELAKSGNFDLSAWTFVPADERGGDRYVFGLSVLKDGTDWEYCSEIRPCLETACTEPHHSWIDGELNDSCSIEKLEHPDGYYIVHGNRDPGEKWNAWVDADNLPDGHAGLKAIRDLVNDFAWMQVECDRLNENASNRQGVAL